MFKLPPLAQAAAVVAVSDTVNSSVPAPYGPPVTTADVAVPNPSAFILAVARLADVEKEVPS